MAALTQAADLLDERTCVIQSDLRIPQDMLAQRRGRHAARLALEQGKPQQAFDFLEHLADSRLAEVHLLRRQVHVAGAAQGVDQQQMAEFEPAAEAGE
ncbi:hypothetical protein D3C78_1758460 [compost metagenome]